MKLKQWPVIQWRLLPGLPSYSSTSYYSPLYPPAQPQLISSFVKPEKKPLVPSPEGENQATALHNPRQFYSKPLQSLC